MRLSLFGVLLGSVSPLAMVAAAQAQDVQLPEIVVQAQRPAPPRPTTAPPEEPNSDLATKNAKFDVARDGLSPRFGASSFDLNRAAIESMPQGLDTPINKVLLQAPGVSQDSAASGDIHVRNEHANVQYRINGITLPDGISGFGNVLDTNFIGSVAVITGALPAQYGLRTSGIVDIQTKSGNSLKQGGTANIEGGSRETLTPSLDYGGRSGNTEYFFAGRGFTSSEGIENPTPALNAIHDRTYQGNFFSYTSTVLDDFTRLSTIIGNTTIRYQIPNNPGQSFACNGDGTICLNSAFGVSSFNSRESERTAKRAKQLRRRRACRNPITISTCSSPLSRVTARCISCQIQSATSCSTARPPTSTAAASPAASRAIAPTVSATPTQCAPASPPAARTAGTAVFQRCCRQAAPTCRTPSATAIRRLAAIAGAYVQDEWRITDQLTLNTGVRFDQMWQYVEANQVSPRVNVVYKPLMGTTFHAGYARYFTPPQQSLAGPVNAAAFLPTFVPPDTTQQDKVLPERSHYFDAGSRADVDAGLAGQRRRLLQDRQAT